MGWCSRYLNSSIGMKSTMAVTGILLFLFALQHCIANLQVFIGAEAMNAYAFKLKSFGPLLWIPRLGLLFVFVVHVFSAMRLTKINRSARPIGYAHAKQAINASLGSRTMVQSGIVVFLFVLYHLAHFTFHWVGGDIHSFIDAAGRPDVYRMFVLGFQNPVSTAIYILANLALGLHLSHGLRSSAQSLGLSDVKYNDCLEKTGALLGWGVAVLNIIMPLSVMLGLITL